MFPALDPLPTVDWITRRFGLFQGTATCDPQVNKHDEVSCACQGCLEWKQFLYGTLAGFPPRRHYEVLTKDFIAGLSSYIRERANASRQNPFRVLEVGGGDGRLYAYLWEALHQQPEAPGSAEVVMVCTDSGASWGLQDKSFLRFPVLLQDCEKALSSHGPHMVLASWMPLGQDWTAAMRATPSVLEYVLIGQADSGMCGDAWLTWGICNESSDDMSSRECYESEDTSSADSSDSGSSLTQEGPGRPGVVQREGSCNPQSMLAPYAKDNFSRTTLRELSSSQICFTDERWIGRRHSSTVSFRRKC